MQPRSSSEDDLRNGKAIRTSRREALSQCRAILLASHIEMTTEANGYPPATSPLREIRTRYQHGMRWLWDSKPGTKSLSIRHISYFCRQFGYALVPQLLRTRIYADAAPKRKVFSTSYLNGLRGITAVKVYTFHYLMLYTDFALMPWKTDERHDRWFMFPVLRYAWSGFTSQIFFAVAGYLISLRLFQLLDKGDVTSQAKVLTSVAASLFRRGFRLYMPVFIITFLTTMHIYFGFYEANRPFLMDQKYTPGFYREIRQPQMSFWPQVRGWVKEMYRLTDITNFETIFCEQDQHLWSIHAEMFASLHMYGCLTAVAMCKRWARLLCLIILTGLYMLWDHWEVWIYLLSAIVAQIDILLTERASAKSDPVYEMLPAADLPTPVTPHVTMLQTTSTTSPHRTPTDRIYRFILFFISGWFMSFPVLFHASTPGYDILKSFIPEYMKRKDKFYPNFGAALFLLLLVRGHPEMSLWRRITNSPTALYLGSISFSIYLVHGPILHWFGYMIPQWIWWSFGTEGKDLGEAAWFVGVFIGWAISLVFVLWAADVWAREIEGRCVKAVKAIEKVSFKQA